MTLHPVTSYTPAEREILRRRGMASVRHKLTEGARKYRRHHLRRLLPHDYEAFLDAAPEVVLARIQFAIRAERDKERRGSRLFDLNRLVGLHQARIAEIRMARAAKAQFQEAAE